MKQLSFILISIMVLTLSGCNLLYTESEEKLSGSEFWDDASASDVNSFVNSMYASLRTATMKNAAFFLFGGDLRCAPVATKLNTNNKDGKWVLALTENRLNDLRDTYATGDYRSGNGIMDWQEMYEVIQTANILIKEVDRTSLSDTEKRMFKAEAVFARCLTYFLLVRNLGDVPYYTNAYNNTPMPRTDMVTVLKNIAAELQQLLDSDPDQTILPMTRTGSDKAIKASRGAVLALLMHVDMWLAGFDESQATTYYNHVVECGKELVDNNGGAYALVPMSQVTNSLFKGASSEGIFEIVQNLTYYSGGEAFLNDAVFSNQVMYKPFQNKSYPNIYYTYDFLAKAYPYGEADERVKSWFDENMYTTIEDYTFKEILKFKNVDTYQTSNNADVTTTNSGNFVLFRLADAILLYAEALADLGTDDAKACELINQVRTRAHASAVQASGQELKDAVYWERVRELIGEGQYYYDLVRTRKIFDGNYCWHTLTRSNFNKGAWTWPISRTALDNNTNMELNSYWE